MLDFNESVAGSSWCGRLLDNRRVSDEKVGGASEATECNDCGIAGQDLALDDQPPAEVIF